MLTSTQCIFCDDKNDTHKAFMLRFRTMEKIFVCVDCKSDHSYSRINNDGVVYYAYNALNLFKEHYLPTSEFHRVY